MPSTVGDASRPLYPAVRISPVGSASRVSGRAARCLGASFERHPAAIASVPARLVHTPPARRDRCRPAGGHLAAHLEVLSIVGEPA